MYKLIEDATKLAGDVDVEILDMHDGTKLDSPSGTAKEIGELVAKTRGESLHDVDRYGRQGGALASMARLLFTPSEAEISQAAIQLIL